MHAAQPLPHLPTEVRLLIAERIERFQDLASLYAVFKAEAFLSQWLRTRILSVHIEVPEAHALGFLTDHVHGELPAVGAE